MCMKFNKISKCAFRIIEHMSKKKYIYIYITILFNEPRSLVNPLRGSISYMIHQNFFSFLSMPRPFSAQSLSNKLLRHH